MILPSTVTFSVSMSPERRLGQMVLGLYPVLFLRRFLSASLSDPMIVVFPC